MPTPDDVAEAEAETHRRSSKTLQALTTCSRSKEEEVHLPEGHRGYYEDDPYTEIGRFEADGKEVKLKKAKFNDYFHFGNWYNHMTQSDTSTYQEDVLY